MLPFIRNIKQVQVFRRADYRFCMPVKTEIKSLKTSKTNRFTIESAARAYKHLDFLLNRTMVEDWSWLCGKKKENPFFHIDKYHQHQRWSARAHFRDTQLTLLWL